MESRTLSDTVFNFFVWPVQWWDWRLLILICR